MHDFCRGEKKPKCTSVIGTKLPPNHPIVENSSNLVTLDRTYSSLGSFCLPPPFETQYPLTLNRSQKLAEKKLLACVASVAEGQKQGDQTNLRKNAQNVAQPIFEKLVRNFNRGKKW
jgi:hypothetical protein